MRAASHARIEADARMAPFACLSAGAWESVATERRTPMQHHIWARARAETLSPGQSVEVAVVGDVTAPAALAPLARSAGFPSRLRLLGAEELGEPVEVAYRDQSAIEALARVLAGASLPIGFGHYFVETPLIAALRTAYRGVGLVVTRPLAQRGAPFIELNEGWCEPEGNFPPGRRSDFRRMQRNAEKMGKVRVDIITPDSRDVAQLLEEALAVETRNWKGRARTAVALDGRLSKFYRRYAELAAHAGILRLCFLRIGAATAAMQIAVECEQRFWLLKIGYDEAFKRCAPGNLLLRETIRHAAERKLTHYEFLGKEAPWTELWTAAARDLVALRTYPFNAAGAAAAAFDGIDLAAARLRKAITRRADA